MAFITVLSASELSELCDLVEDASASSLGISEEECRHGGGYQIVITVDGKAYFGDYEDSIMTAIEVLSDFLVEEGIIT